MQGASRGALAAGRDELARRLTESDPGRLGEELFFAASTLDTSAGLRRALTDASRATDDKSGLVDRLFGERLSQPAAQVLGTLVAQRWSAERDLGDGLDRLAAEALLAGAERQGRLDQVESDLFQLGRVVGGSPELLAALADDRRSGDDKSALLDRLLEGKAAPETVRLAEQAARSPRGQRFDRALQRYADVAAEVRHQLVAVVTTAVPLTPEHTERLTRALSSMYDCDVKINVVHDPEVVGGIRVQVGDEVIDGTIARRLDDVRRRMAG